MKLLGNILWLIFGGLFISIGYLLTGLLFCITIIGIPFGMQLFRLAKFVLWPFGKEVETNFDKHPVANILWIIFFGIEMAGGCLVSGVLLTITIIGIPFGKQWFKLMRLSFMPFGAKIK